MNGVTQFPKTNTRVALIGIASLLGVLVIAAGLVATSLLDVERQTEQTKINAPASRDLGSITGPSLIVYLVDSQEQEHWIIGMEDVFAADRAGSTTPQPNYSFLVLSMTTPGAEADLAEISEAWAAQPEGLQIFDMRPRQRSLD